MQSDPHVESLYWCMQKDASAKDHMYTQDSSSTSTQNSMPKMGGAGSARALVLLPVNRAGRRRYPAIGAVRCLNPDLLLPAQLPRAFWKLSRSLYYRQRGKTIAYGVAGDCRGWSGRRETRMSPEPSGKHRLSQSSLAVYTLACETIGK